MSRLCSLREALADDRLLGGLIDGPSWLRWRAIILATQGETLTPEEREAFTEVTGRLQEPTQPVDEAWLICGRRAGKSRCASILAAYTAAFKDHSSVLVPGETGVLAVMSATTRQAEVLYRYLHAIFTEKPLLARMLTKEPTADTISLRTEDRSLIEIEVRPANFRSIRGLTLIGLVADEVAFWPNDLSTNADTEILNGARPGLATTSGQVLSLTSPYSRRGEAWNVYKAHYGPTGDPAILVVNGASRQFNPDLPEAVVTRAYERDHAAASSEFGGCFRTDLESLVSREAVDAVTVTGRFELPPISGLHYFGFVDPSGAGADAMTMAIAHRDTDGKAILDCVRVKKPPFSPASVVTEFCETLKAYNLSKVVGDHWGGEFAKEPFRTEGITYELTDKVRSDIYLDLLPILNSGKVELLDHKILVSELCALERRTAKSGKDSVNHPPNGHDDVINSAAGALVLAANKRPPMAINRAALDRFSEPTQYGRPFRYGGGW